MQLDKIKKVYFLGIGGIGMSAIARWFLANNFLVAGYDKTPTALTNILETEGAEIHFEDNLEMAPAKMFDYKDEVLIIYTPAIPKDHKEYNWLVANGFEILKRSQVLGLLTQHMYTIAVAGTHGKTTTSSMIAHILKQAGKNVTAFLGGITQNYGTNFLINQGKKDLICVVEADEFDRSFLTLSPNIAIVTSTDADHLDIYGSHSHVLESFQLFVEKIKPGGSLFLQDSLALNTFQGVNKYSYAIETGLYKTQNLKIENAEFSFDIESPQGNIEAITMLLPGFHNVENAVAAAAACQMAGLTTQEIKQGLCTFGGVKRRFEYILKAENKVFIDDYAHHPTEISAFLKSVKALYPTKKITAIFQPHLFSRTNDFQVEFAQSLELADELWLLEIYPARELPMEGVTSKIIFDKINNSNKQLCTLNDLELLAKTAKPELLVTIGAGNIDTKLEALKLILESQM